MRLIDADVLIESIKNTADLGGWIGEALYQIKQVAIKYIDSAPTIEPKRGEWIWHEDEDICNCSECEFEIDATGCIDPMEYVGVFRYCPNCGADMRKESE